MTHTPAVQQLVADIRGNRNRREAFDTLVRLQTPEATAGLLDLLADYRIPPFYTDIIHELGQRGAIDPMQHFQQILAVSFDTEVDIRQPYAALTMLPRYPHHPLTVPLIVDVLHRADHWSLLRSGVYALAQIGNDEAVYVLSRLMDTHPNAKVRHHALNVLGSSGNPLAVTTLLNYLERDHAGTEREAVPGDCVNAMNGLLRLWEGQTRPFAVSRWLAVLAYWLYRDRRDYPSALYTLKKLTLPEAAALIEAWEQWRRSPGDRPQTAAIFR